MSTQPGHPSVVRHNEYQLKRITVGLALQWPCVTDNSALPTYGLNSLCQGDEHPTYLPAYGTPLHFTSGQ